MTIEKRVLKIEKVEADISWDSRQLWFADATGVHVPGIDFRRAPVAATQGESIIGMYAHLEKVDGRWVLASITRRGAA